MSKLYHDNDDDRNYSGPFIISEYSSLLGDKQENGKYVCPKCGEKALSINKDGRKFDCYGCHDTKGIAYELRKLNGEFEPKGKKTTTSKSNVPSSAPRNVPKRGDDDKPPLAELLEFLQEHFKGLRLNELTLEPYLGDEKFSEAVCPVDHLYTWIADKHGKQWGKEQVIDSVMYLAGRDPFCPARDYLTNLAYQTDVSKEDISFFDSLASHLLGTKKTLYDEYLKRWILAAVARPLFPGCYVRSALILRGAQGIGKTTFFKILGGEFFSSSLGDARGKDELMVAHRHWILEWGELETLWSRKELGDVKAFLTRTEDCFRAPYARAVAVHPRKFVLCGSTNEQEFLTDQTGNTRFWVIDCGDKPIELDLFAESREVILAIAAAQVLNEWEYCPDNIRNGKLWELPKEYWQQNVENTKLFEEYHPFEPVLREVIEEIGGNTIHPEKFWEALDIPVKERRRYRKQLGAILNELGWKTTVKRVNGEPKRMWVRKEPIEPAF